MKRSLLALAVLVLLLTLAAAPVMAQDASNTIRIALQQEPDTLNLYYSNMWFATTVQDVVHASNWVIDNNLNAVPVIAAEIPSSENGGVSADGKTITFTIRDNAVWSDGTPITADDFVFTYDMIMADSNTPTSRDPWDTKVASVVADGDKTVIITTNEPYAPWLAKLQIQPFPAHVLRPVFESEGTLDSATWNREPDVSSGPYKFVSWEAGSGMSFTRNENYFLEPAKVENVSVLFVPDDATVVSALIAGDTDVGTFIATGDTPALEETGSINIELVPSGYNEGLFFNVGEKGHSALQDVNVRKALVMLVDRDTINADLNLGINTTGSSFWEKTPYQRPDAAPIPYDPEGAAAALDEAGWTDSNGDGTRDKDGVELALRYVTNQRQVRKDVQAVVQQAFADAGVGLELLNFDSDVFFADYANGGPMSLGEYDIGEYSSSPSFPDPDTVRFTCAEVPSDENPVGTNDNHFCDPAVDELFAQQASTVDPDARIAIFHQIDQYLFDQVIWTSMWYDPDLW
ncbi:MAG: peptide ABC transporter substrate-binding protein, partial [Anaerolineae bacterium]|nr:peptide ABC transporter substrate-binding protein [Anaerolineae bacterium]